jgi:hypothetical protein
LEQVLKRFDVALDQLRAIERKLREDYRLLRAKADLILEWRLGVRPLVENYLVYSTILSLFLQVMIIHKGVDIFWGYPIVVGNTVILLALNRLLIHRNHALFVALVMIISLVASRFSGTPLTSIVAQIIGILVFSIYYFSMLTTQGLTIPQWMKLYVNGALILTIWGIIDFIGRKLHVFPETVDPRLHSVFREPSFFVYITLPAISIYLSAQLRRGGYWLELSIFLLAYAMADSSLGFLGLFLVAFFAFLPRLNFWRMFLFAALAAGALAAAFFLSANFRLRVIDTALGIALLDLQHLNASTFAILANAYVSAVTFIHHPLIGVGIGGYQFQYMQFAPNLSNDDPDVVTLNMYDAASLFFRTAAELGAFGLISLFGFLIVCSRVRGDTHLDIRNAIVPFFLMRMGRYGAYFSLDLYFFVGMYFLNYMHYRRQSRPNPRALEPQHAA